MLWRRYLHPTFASVFCVIHGCANISSRQFNRGNNLKLICRAHQLVMEGYKSMFKNQLVTVWSAPNYCYRCGNVASIMEFDEHLTSNFKIFSAAPDDSRTKPMQKP